MMDRNGDVPVTIRFVGGSRDGTELTVPRRAIPAEPLRISESDGPWWDDPARSEALTGEMYAFERTADRSRLWFAGFVGYP